MTGSLTLKEELLERIAEGGIDGVVLEKVMDELVDEVEELEAGDLDADEAHEQVAAAESELRAEGRIADDHSGGCRISHREIAIRVLACGGDLDGAIRVLRGKS